jgi:anti-sigma regulatory factor (Ser/Thr protein kinase)
MNGAVECEPGSRRIAELHIPANSRELSRAREFVDRAARAHGLEREQRFDFGLAANEAVTNAIRHGRPDADGRIMLRVETTGSRLTLLVRDYGSFIAPQPTTPRPLDSGRGLSMMQAASDAFALESDGSGTVVRLSKDLP